MNKLALVAALILFINGCGKGSQSESKQIQTPSSPTLYGTETGNGTEDDLYAEGVALFVDSDRTIHYCFEVSSNFGVRVETVDEMVSSAFKKWTDYISSKKVHEANGVQFASRTEKLKACDGSEDLIFYLGTHNNMIDSSMSGLKTPWAFAGRISYNVERRWGKGFVRLASQGEYVKKGDLLAPDWRPEGNLEAVLIHEIGHLFGNGHIDGTIMRADLIDHLTDRTRASEDATKSKSLEIDQDFELYSNPLKTQSYPGKLGTSTQDGDTELVSIAKNFELLTGESPTGHIQSELLYRFDGEKSRYSLILHDSSRRLEFDLAETLDSEQICGIKPIFKILEGTLTHENENWFCKETFFSITTRSGEVLMVQVLRNAMLELGPSHGETLLSNRVVLKLIRENATRNLFVSTY